MDPIVSSEQTPVLSTPIPPVGAGEQVNQPIFPPPPPSSKPSHSKLWTVIGIIAVVLLLVAGVSVWGYMQKNAQSISNEPIPTMESPSIKPTEQVVAVKDPKRQLLIQKDPNKDVQGDLQAWLMTPDGKNLTQLELPDFSNVVKLPDSALVYYTQFSTPNLLHVTNILTHKSDSYTLITHSDPTAIANSSFYNSTSVAPDGSGIVFQVMFTTVCPTESIQPQQGGHGPCEPSPDPALPGGTYFYNFKTHEHTYLGDTVYVSRWDASKHMLYFNDNKFKENGLFAFDIATKKITLVDKATTFGYGAFPFLKSDLLVKIDASTGNSGDEPSLSKISVVDRKTKEATELATGLWADIQPFASISPDEQTVIFLRTPNLNGFQMGNLYAYDVATKKVTHVATSTDTESYSIHGIWIDNTTFITTIDTVEQPQYYNGNNILVSINVKTGEIKRLTSDDVYRFNSM